MPKKTHHKFLDYHKIVLFEILTATVPDIFQAAENSIRKKNSHFQILLLLFALQIALNVHKNVIYKWNSNILWNKVT